MTSVTGEIYSTPGNAPVGHRHTRCADCLVEASPNRDTLRVSGTGALTSNRHSWDGAVHQLVLLG